MASKIAEKAPGWFTRLLMPELVEIKGKLENLGTRMDSTNDRINSLRNELKADIQRVDSRVEDLDKRLDIVQRLAIIEAKLREQEKRLSHES